MKSAALFAACALVASALRTAAATPQQTTLQSARGEFWSVDNETFFVFESSATKRVTLTGTNLKIVCNHLEITTVGLTKGDKSGTLPALEKFKYMLATGDVVILQADREARAGRAEVLPRENKVVLTEHPVVIDHADDVTKDGVVDHSQDNIGRGSRITMLRGERRVIIEDTELEAPPIKDLGFDKKQSPAPAGASPSSEPKK
jgi:lipopolysaccharide export system protein LptA